MGRREGKKEGMKGGGRVKMRLLQNSQGTFEDGTHIVIPTVSCIKLLLHRRKLYCTLAHMPQSAKVYM